MTQHEENPKTLYKVVLNDNTEAEHVACYGSLEACEKYVVAMFGEETAIKKLLDDGIKIKPAKKGK